MPHTTPYSQELYTTQRPEVLASTSYSKIPYTTPYTTLYSLSPSESTQVIVGETAFLPCRAYGVSSIDSRIYWEKLDGAMPSQFRIGDTALVIPKVKKQDAGTYRCIVDTVDGQNHVAIAELSVGDYIPTFDGSRIIEITPLTHEQWQRLDLEISLRPNKENGVVYHAERHAPAQDHQLFHDIALKRGHVVYTFDVGNGVSRVQSPVSIKNGEWSKIRIRNDESRVSLNVNHQTSGHARNAPLPYIKEINDGTVYLGGIPGHSKQYQQLKQPENFAGSISKLVINGKSIDIGESATSPPEVVLQLSTNECFDSPCQNAAQCVPAHEFEGFKCECEAEFTGEYCQFRTGLCSNKEMCEHGVCVDGDWGENHCVCPYGRYGKYCENMKTDIPIITYDEMGRANKGSKFNGRTSFISVPAPQSSRHFRLSLDINPKNSQKPQLLAYVASTYNTKKAEYMALVLQDEALYGLYHGKHGTNQLRSYGRVNANKTHDVSFLHSGKTIELIVDGRRTMQHLEEPAFSTGTALYIGGLAPGMMVTEELEQYGNYEGCLSTIRVNRQLIEVESTRDVESGDLGECMLNVDEVYVTASPSEVRPIYIPPARGEQEYYTPGEHLPLQSRNKDVTVPPDDGLESVSITEFTGSEDHFTPRMTVLPTTTTTTQRPTTTSTLPPTTTLTTTTTELTTTTEASTTTSYWYYSTTVATTRRKNLYRVTSTRKPTTTVRPYTTVDYYITKGLEYDTTTVYLTSTTTYPTTSTTTITRRPYTTSTVTMKPTEQYVHVASEDDTVATLRPTDKVLPSTTVHTITKDSMLDTTRIIRPTKPPNVELDNRPVDNTKTEPISTIQTQPLSTAKSEEARDLEVDETSEELTIEDPDELPDTATTISPLVTKVVDLPTDVPPHDSYVSDIDSEELKETKITPTMTSDDDLKAKSSLHTTEIVYEEDSLETTEIVRPTESLDEVRLGLCEDADCGEHGVCEPVNQTHVACACRDYYVGPNCDQFKPIEYAAKFEGNAWIMFSVDDFPHLTSEKREIVEFRFKTTAEYGVMLWQGQTTETSVIGEDYVSIGLNDGFLVFSYELGGGAAQIISETPVNDGKEHYVRVERRGRNGTLVVDNQEPVEGRSSGILAMLNVEGNIYVGGLPDLTTMTAGLHSHNFVGCIADLRLNEDPLDLMGNAIDGKNVRPCDGWTRKRKWLQQKYRHRRFRTHG
ncbi:unnamed protein product [Bursaphelenchus okinawaensis]|uniref:Basement membrane-specific heparan sulfate proteoglycan core protein n=1 Tax=Bursaphelenchus okinawaensis TaxID=465554 RepID=A0A811KBU3_9BILA|nr:unnamed protein product [Bursaphelenchus okinawaensis]CAG9097343.1 unnamed protein product [Bursaphelenchus okinawaensis]